MISGSWLCVEKLDVRTPASTLALLINCRLGIFAMVRFWLGSEIQCKWTFPTSVFRRCPRVN